MPDELPIAVRDARRDIARLVTERNTLLRNTSRTGIVDHVELDRIDGLIGGLLDTTTTLVDPCDARPDLPLVLLPVRLETKFATAGRRSVLKVRIYPDEIHVDALTRGLTTEETFAGQAYWTAVWADPVPEGAWDVFVAAVGAHRAEWVAHVTTPTNLAERSLGSVPDFARVDARTPRNVVARALPDRFVVVATQGGRVSKETGNAIPRDLVMSPMPLEGDDPTRVADALTVPPGAEWLIDYDAAVAVGMAVTLPLAGGAAPIERLVAIGTRGSLAPAASADELEDLLRGHRFGDGFGLVAQGTPTNNSDGERSPYRPRRTPAPPPLVPVAAVPGSDAAALARQLGLDTTAVTALVGDGTGEQLVAGQVNTALWNPGWGTYLARLDERGVPGVVDAERESARLLFRNHVRGRGVAPTIHVGAQPYGVAPVSNLATWRPAPNETSAGVAAVVRMLLPRWLVAADRRLPTIRPGTSRIDDALLEVLGSSPVMQGLRVRPVLTDDVSDAMLAALGIDHREFEAERMSMAAPLFALLGSDAYKAAIGSLHVDDRPLPLPLASDRDPEFITALLAGGVVPAIDSVLQALAALAWRSEELDVAKAAPAAVLPELLQMIEVTPELRQTTFSTVAKADSASPDELHLASARLVEAGVAVGSTATLRTYEPIEVLQTSLGEVALSAPSGAKARELAATAVAGWLRAMGYRGEVREALQGLAAGSTTAARALAVAETLDCSSHRIDAWATGVFADRRARQAAGTPRGLTIGAYGVVEDLAPAPVQPLDGWIHAPTTRHAVAAGMLRSSHLSHLPTSGPATAGGPFAVDMSSVRLRAALQMIQGVRNGQPLGALVGYRIERDLASAGLARLQLSLRTIAPLVAHRLHDAAGDEIAAQEAIAANNVVDGVLLLQRHPPGDATLRPLLDQEPVNPYLESGDWEPVTTAQWNTVQRILIAAADTIDAVADVLLAESVLQYAGGNAARAAAAMDAMGTGAAPSDSLDVLEAADSAARLNHKVVAIAGEDAPPTRWVATRPRALAEPALEAWASSYLGDPATIVVADGAAGRVTLDVAGLCALDVVFQTDLLALERMLRATVPAIGFDDELVVRRDAAWPASLRALGQVIPLATALREVVANAQPLLPADLTRSGQAPTRTTDTADLLARLDQLVGGLESTVAATSGALAVLSDDDIVDTLDERDAVAAQLAALDAFGLGLPAPDDELPLDLRWARTLWQTAESRAIAARAAHTACVAVVSAGSPEHLVIDSVQDAVEIVLTGGFRIVPRLVPGPTADAFAQERATPAIAQPDPSAISRFVTDHATVRAPLQRLADARLLAGALDPSFAADRWSIVQMAQRLDDGTPAPATDRWLAGPLPDDAPWPDGPTVHCIADLLGTAGATVSGLVVDGWVEDLPERVAVNADPAALRPRRARTGLALRANAASARPPQAILCAVSPDGVRWTADSIRGVIDQTLDLARARLVTLERLAGDAVALPALYVRSSSLQGKPYIDFRELVKVPGAYVAMKYVKEGV